MAGAVNGPVIRMLGRLIRRVGKVVDDAGVSLQGKNAYTERGTCTVLIAPAGVLRL